MQRSIMMRPLALFFCLALLTTTAPASAAAGDAQQLVFPLQEKHVHSSSIVECPNGDLLACWFRGSGERRSADVLIQGARLKQGAGQWSHVFLMADTPDFPDCNPVLFVDRHRQLWLFWIAVMAERWEDSLLRCRTSHDFEDDGPPRWAWQDDILLKPGAKFADALARGYATIDSVGLNTDFGGLAVSPQRQLLRAANDLSQRQRGWMPRTHPLQLPSGRIVLPLYSDGFYVGLMALSDDDGKTWRASEPIVGVGINQPALARQRDGTLVAYMREEGPIRRRVLRSVSRDDGATWSVAEPTEMPNPNSSVDIVTLHDGRWAMVYNDTERGRDSLVMALSDNEGKTWNWRRHLERKTGGQFHYPSIIETRDRHIHVTYTYEPRTPPGRSIKHVSFDPQWIVDGD
jgi:predicted neuraminidase